MSAIISKLVDAQRTQLEQMMLTFLKAGKAYQEAESTSEHNLNNLRVSVNGHDTYLDASSSDGMKAQ